MKNLGPDDYLSPVQIQTVDQAVTIAEDIISDHFQLTISSWKKYRYDIRTLKDLSPEEIVPDVFAQIIRYARPVPPDGLRVTDFYRICLQDHNIIAALRRDPALALLPLCLYVLTHELVHLVRFYKFFQFFHADEKERAAEEIRVHEITYQILKSLKFENMAQIFEFYALHRQMVD